MAKRKIELSILHPSGYSEKVKLTIPIAEILIPNLLERYIVFVREENEWVMITDKTEAINVFMTDKGRRIIF